MVMVEVQGCETSWRSSLVCGCVVVVLGLHATLTG